MTIPLTEFMKDPWIRKTWEYKTIYREGKKQVGKYFILYWSPGNKENARFGITVSKRIGHAVVRNKVKRMIREMIRKDLKDLLRGYVVIVVARKKILNSTFHEIRDSLMGMVKKLLES